MWLLLESKRVRIGGGKKGAGTMKFTSPNSCGRKHREAIRRRHSRPNAVNLNHEKSDYCGVASDKVVPRPPASSRFHAELDAQAFCDAPDDQIISYRCHFHAITDCNAASGSTSRSI